MNFCVEPKEICRGANNRRKKVDFHSNSQHHPADKMYCNHEIRAEFTRGSLNGISLYFSTECTVTMRYAQSSLGDHSMASHCILVQNVL